MADPTLLAVIFAVFILAGFVKGVIGLGLPTIALALLTALIGLPQAMALMIVPAFLTNLWQALAGGGAGTVFRRIWPFLTGATVTVWIGALALTRVDVALLAALLGVLLAFYAVVSLAGLRFRLAPRHDAWAGPLFGVVNGVLTGMTGSYAIPGLMYLQALGLPRDALIQAMGMLFLGSTLALGLALGTSGVVAAEFGIYSLLAIVPALLGLYAGQRLRRRLSELQFRRLFFAGLLVLGVYIAATSLLA